MFVEIGATMPVILIMTGCGVLKSPVQARALERELVDSLLKTKL